ncbi:MAG TPA: hypothetical protein VFR00_02680 [Hyphomicrobiaceae bacterium]|nr:hypothetical protein [Hyphomicrobiaceae bacterium]
MRVRSRLAGIALLCGALLMVAPSGRPGPHPATAQQGQPVSLDVAAVTNAAPASRVRLPIEVRPRDALAKNSFIRIRGLPATAALSEGYAIAPGSWAVPLNGLASLMVILPVGLEGRSEVVVALVNVEGSILAEATTTLVVARAATQPPPPAPVAAAPPNSTTRALSAPQLAPADRERALKLHARGQEQLGRGNIYAARQFFERAAEAGLAESALALAATYDPTELARLSVLGLKAEPAEARKWYEKARELGASEADARLRRLPAR